MNGQPGIPSDIQTWLPKKLTPTQVANYLGWVQKQMPDQICPGYYVEPSLAFKSPYPTAGNNNGPIHVSADQSSFSQTGASILVGSVQVNQPNEQINGEKAYLNRDPNTQKINSIDVYGHVIVRQPGNMAMGEAGHFDLVDKSLYLNNVLYRTSFGPITPVGQSISAGAGAARSQSNSLSLNTSANQSNPPNANASDTQSNPPPLDTPVTVQNLNGWGVADQMNRDSQGIIHVLKGTYTACPPETSFWKLVASKLTLNRDTGRGVARNGFLYLKGVPVFYSPYFSFPIDNRRQTGFLTPSFGHSSRSGVDISTPFYWNIAPNYDATITPDYLSLRGLQLNGLFRYLTPTSSGNFHGSFLPNDNAFSQYQQQQKDIYNPTSANPNPPPAPPGYNALEDDSDDRYFVSFKDNRRYSDQWSSYLYLNHVSDDYYFEDFNNDAAQTTSNQILNQADLYYNNTHWNFTGQMQGYQTLHPINQGTVSNQYMELPELKLNGNYPEFLGDLSFNIANQYDDFQINQNPWQTANQKQVFGQRAYTDPELSLPKYWLWGFIKPDVQLTATQYDLRDQSNPAFSDMPPYKNQTIDRTIPIFDIDSGLYFERNYNLDGGEYKQTLEPRLFYLYVPYENQDDIPLFDTSIDPFNYAQLFQTNRYDGIDRIGDTNQISAALTSRFLNEQTGDEILRASIGQIYYFEDRRVNLTEQQAGLVAFDNQVSPDASSSPIAGELEYHITKSWLALGDVAWAPSDNTVNNSDLALQYHRDDDHLLNFGYHFLRGGDALEQVQGGQTVTVPGSAQNLNQTDFSAVWPLTEKWKFIGRWNYNISHNYPQTYYGGLEYEACCWAFRTMVGRSFDYLQPNNRPVFDQQIYFQIALKTLGNVGTNDPTHMLTRDIPGYVDRFGAINSF